MTKAVEQLAPWLAGAAASPYRVAYWRDRPIWSACWSCRGFRAMVPGLDWGLRAAMRNEELNITLARQDTRPVPVRSSRPRTGNASL